MMLKDNLTYPQEQTDYFEGKIIRDALQVNEWNKEKTARGLDVDLATLCRKIQKLGISEA